MWDKKIYIAAPYTAYPDLEGWETVEGNVEKYLAEVANAMNQGYVVLSWIYNHLTYKYGLTGEHDAKWYLDQDKKLIDCADMVWVCGPHNISSGMQEEIAHAQKIGTPVRFIYKEQNNLDPCPWCQRKPILLWRHNMYYAYCDTQCHANPEVRSSSLQETIRRWNTREAA